MNVNVYGAVITIIAIVRAHRVQTMNADSATGGCRPWNQDDRLGLWIRQYAVIHHRPDPLLPHTNYYSARNESWYSFYSPMEGGRLCRGTSVRLYITVAVMINTTACSGIRTWDFSDSSQHLITQFFTGRMLFLMPKQQCRINEGKIRPLRPAVLIMSRNQRNSQKNIISRLYL